MCPLAQRTMVRSVKSSHRVTTLQGVRHGSRDEPLHQRRGEVDPGLGGLQGLGHRRGPPWREVCPCHSVRIMVSAGPIGSPAGAGIAVLNVAGVLDLAPHRAEGGLKAERTIGLCMNARRNARDYERLPQHSEAHLNWALITMMTRRLIRKSPRTSQWTKKPTRWPGRDGVWKPSNTCASLLPLLRKDWP